MPFISEEFLHARLCLQWQSLRSYVRRTKITSCLLHLGGFSFAWSVLGLWKARKQRVEIPDSFSFIYLFMKQNNYWMYHTCQLDTQSWWAMHICSLMLFPAMGLSYGWKYSPFSTCTGVSYSTFSEGSRHINHFAWNLTELERESHLWGLTYQCSHLVHSPLWLSCSWSF